ALSPFSALTRRCAASSERVLSRRASKSFAALSSRSLSAPARRAPSIISRRASARLFSAAAASPERLRVAVRVDLARRRGALDQALERLQPRGERCRLGRLRNGNALQQK